MTEAYTDLEMDLICYKAEADEYRKKYNELRIKYEELQEVLVSTDEELDYYREKYVSEALQHDYLRKELIEIKARLSIVESTIRESNRFNG